ncbi:MAG: HEAT repeat domain-containing protein [Tepidiformaceae bacterium]
MTTPQPSQSIENTIRPLVHALGGRDPLPPWSARRALEAIGPAASPSLVQSMRSPEPETRWEAAKALVTIADPASAPALVSALEDEDGSVRWLAAEGLSHIGYPALPPLLHALIEHSGSAWLRDGARHVLRGNLSDALAPALSPVLRALTGPSPEIAVMPAASQAIKMLESLPLPPVAPPSADWHGSRLPAMTPGHGAWRNLRFQG